MFMICSCQKRLSDILQRIFYRIFLIFVCVQVHIVIFSFVFMPSPIYCTFIYFSTINRTFMCFHNNFRRFLLISRLFLYQKSLLQDFVFMDNPIHPISCSHKYPFLFSLSVYFGPLCSFLQRMNRLKSSAFATQLCTE